MPKRSHQWQSLMDSIPEDQRREIARINELALTVFEVQDVMELVDRVSRGYEEVSTTSTGEPTR